LAEAPQDLVLLDLDLPDMQGTHLCRQLRSEGYKQPIVMLTCHNQGYERAAGLDCGADDYLGKPFLPEELLARIRAQLRREERFTRSVEDLMRERWNSIDQGMHLAQKMQHELSDRRGFNGISTVARHVPVGRIGGDFFLLEQVDEHHAAVAMADTMGKGLGAALVMSWTLAATYRLIKRGLPPAQVLTHLTEELGADLDKLGVFVALFCGLFDRRSGAFHFSSAGAEPPIFIHRDQGRGQRRHRRLSTAGLPVGVITDIPYRQETIYPSPGDQLFLFTDGLTESVDVKLQPTLLRQLYRQLLETFDLPLSERADRLLQTTRRLTGNQLILRDDLTFLLMEFPASETPPLERQR
jgi:serine phosphatase RsbU (regulator of sigma subunit)